MTAIIDKPLKTKNYPVFGVIFYKDNNHSDTYIIQVLERIFRRKKDDIVVFLKDFHKKGEAIAWRGSFEIAEFKASLVSEFGPDVYAKPEIHEPLNVSVIQVS